MNFFFKIMDNFDLKLSTVTFLCLQESTNFYIPEKYFKTPFYEFLFYQKNSWVSTVSNLRLFDTFCSTKNAKRNCVSEYVFELFSRRKTETGGNRLSFTFYSTLCLKFRPN